MKPLSRKINVKKIREDFPILSLLINKKPLVYLDNSATTQKPASVINTLKQFYENHNANIHRGVHKLAEEATKLYEEAHKKVSNFINADFEEVVFTRNTTESLNLLAYSLFHDLKENDEIILSKMEHHSNLVPWQQIAKLRNIKVKYINLDGEGNLDLNSLSNLLNKNTKIVSLTHVSNVLGAINPVKQISKIVHDNNSLFILDGAQGVPHIKVDVKKLDVDFLAFSAHKMCGPTGVGALYGKKEFLEKMSPFLYGGHMIKEVSFDNSTFNDLPWKFEAGTAQIAEAIAFGTAIDYLNKIGMENIEEYEKDLVNHLYKRLSEQNKLTVYGPKKRAALVSFNLNNIHPHDVATVLDSQGIAIRVGHMCAIPLVREVLRETALCRASLYFYNTKEEIDKFISSLDLVRSTLKWN